jgi:uncharacterized protein
MQPPLPHLVNNESFLLSAERAMFWEKEKILVVSDLHLGKSGHFRKAGIAIPQNVLKEDMQRLVNLIQYFNPASLLVVGDFFHSHANLELDFFIKWRRDLSSLPITLVRGNHDILKKKWYEEADIEVVEEKLYIGGFCFSHHECEEPNHYTFCGHTHPGIIVNGLGRQSLRLPCFYFTEHYCILPAFGKFTGLYTIEKTKRDTAFAIVQDALVKL